MIEIPFRLASDDVPIILVQARVNGVKHHEFIVDTGNGAPMPCLVAPSLVQRLGLSPVTAAESPKRPFPAVRLQRLEFGDYRLENIEAGLLEAIDQIGARIGVAVAGNIGYALLKNWRLGIDYQNSRLRLSNGGDMSLNQSMPFATGPGGAFILLTANVNGQKSYRFLLDTGASTSVISPKLATELNLSGQLVEAVGVAGSTAAQLATLQSLTVGNYKVENLLVAIIDVFEYTSQAAGAPVDGIIGHSFLKEFFVEIDYPTRRLRLARRQ